VTCISANAFTPPPGSAIPKGPFGDSVRRGEAIFTDTQKNGRPFVGRGKAGFASHCVAREGADGNGNKQAGVPPLWGPRSFNKGAGMYQVETAAKFIHTNMPLGQGGTLSVQQAYDIAAYINSQPRPADPRILEKSAKR